MLGEGGICGLSGSEAEVEQEARSLKMTVLRKGVGKGRRNGVGSARGKKGRQRELTNKVMGKRQKRKE